MKEQTKKQKARSKRWDKRICIKGKQKLYVAKEQQRLGFNSEAGTLDYIINKYKKYENS